MVKYIILFLINNFFIIQLIAQKNDSLVSGEYYGYKALINGTIFQQSPFDAEYRLFVNNKLIDETGLSFRRIFYWNHNFVGFNIKSNINLDYVSELYVFNDTSWEIRKVLYSNNFVWPFFSGTKYLYIGKSYINKSNNIEVELLILDMENSVFKDTINISNLIKLDNIKLVGYSEISDSTGVITINQNSKGPFFYELNKNNYTINEISCYFKNEIESLQEIPINSNQKVIAYFEAPSYNNIQIVYYDSTLHARTILKKTYNEEILTVKPSVNEDGILVTGDNIQKYYRSRLDTREVVFVLFGFDFIMENLFFCAKNDIELLEKNLLQLNSNQLIYLIKMIYARHNYKFESTYDQAYFNLFKFYNESTFLDHRNSNIDKLFTENDKKNISLIKEILQKKGINADVADMLCQPNIYFSPSTIHH